MATTTASHYALGFLEAGGRVRDYLELDRVEPRPSEFWAVRLGRFWPANRPGQPNDPWNCRSSVGRDRGALSLRVAPLLRSRDETEATTIRVFDVETGGSPDDRFPPVMLNALLPARIRAGDGIEIQADLVDVSLFTTVDQIAAEAGRIINRSPRPWSRLAIDVTDTISLLSDLGGAALQSLWQGVLHPRGVDARAWDPHRAHFSLYGPSLDATPRARPGTYLLIGGWEPIDLRDAHYDPLGGLHACREDPAPIVANVLEFELLPLK